MAARDLTGRRFGKLVVIERVCRDNSRRALWKCKCDCGKEKIIRGDSIRDGRTKSCGCLYANDLSGRRFGRLVVTSKSRTSRRKNYTVKQWECKCDCGSFVWVNSQDLTTKHSTSCGCYQEEINRSRTLEFGLASKRKCYSGYKRSAKKKNRRFELSMEAFLLIASKPCYYCGLPPSNFQRAGGYNGPFIYSGIDRLNSSLGYINKNCVPCCITCNIAKHDMTYEAFKQWVNRACLHLSKRNYRKPFYAPCVLVAEIGCNHMGDIKIAQEMIKTAKLCGADYVKFQKRCPKICVPQDVQTKPHKNQRNAFGKTYLEHRENLEFTVDQHRKLKKYCDELGIKYSCSVWDVVSAKEIISLNPDYIKIPSAMNGNYELLEFVYEKFPKDVHVSLGMATRSEIKMLTDFLRPHLRRTILYWTTSGYPVDFNELFLLEVKSLCDKGFRVGFSGHHRGIAIDVAAYTFGSIYIERHFTLDRTWRGTDHAASLEPGGLHRLSRDLHAVYQSFMLKRHLTEDEKLNRSKLRPSE